MPDGEPSGSLRRRVAGAKTRVEAPGTHFLVTGGTSDPKLPTEAAVFTAFVTAFGVHTKQTNGGRITAVSHHFAG